MLRAWNIIVENDVRLDKMMKESLAIYDQSLYHLRQSYFATLKSGEKINTPNYYQLWDIVKNEDAFTSSTLNYGSKQYAIRQASQVWQAYIKARVAYKKNPKKFNGEPKLPNYLYKKKDFNLVQVDKTKFAYKNLEENSIAIGCSDYRVKIPKKINLKDVHQITIQKFYGKTKINIIYEDKETLKNKFDSNSAIGIDIGVNNLCAITSNDKPFSYVINGRPLKSMNQFYNKRLAELKSQLEICNKTKTSKQVESLCRKRFNKIDNYMHNVSKKIIDLCIENNVEKIYIGHNDGWKQECDMSKKNNQNFVQIPFNKLIEQIKFKSQKYTDLSVEVVEEGYTSKCDHLAFEEMKHHDEYAGKRVKRGLFKSSVGKDLNADINGAIGILRKGKAVSDVQLMDLRNRGDVVSPVVLEITCK